MPALVTESDAATFNLRAGTGSYSTVDDMMHLHFLVILDVSGLQAPNRLPQAAIPF